jgi:hypothetical protein
VHGRYKSGFAEAETEDSHGAVYVFHLAVRIIRRLSDNDFPRGLERDGVAGGLREVVATAIFCVVAGRILDVYAKRLNPRLKNTWRGWHYPE